MPRLNNETAALLSDLSSRLQSLVEVARAEGRDAALAEVRQLVGGTSPAVPRRRPGRPKGSKNAPGKKRKNSWAGLSSEARLARINAIRKGKGLPAREK